MTEREQFIAQLFQDIKINLSAEDKTFCIQHRTHICCHAKALLQMRDNIIYISSFTCNTGWADWPVKYILDITNPNCDIIGKFIDVVNSADVISATKYRYGR